MAVLDRPQRGPPIRSITLDSKILEEIRFDINNLSPVSPASPTSTPTYPILSMGENAWPGSFAHLKRQQDQITRLKRKLMIAIVAFATLAIICLIAYFSPISTDYSSFEKRSLFARGITCVPEAPVAAGKTLPPPTSADKILPAEKHPIAKGKGAPAGKDAAERATSESTGSHSPDRSETSHRVNQPHDNASGAGGPEGSTPSGQGEPSTTTGTGSSPVPTDMNEKLKSHRSGGMRIVSSICVVAFTLAVLY